MRLTDEQRQAKRDQVKAMAAEAGVKIHRLPSGLYQLHGRGVDLLVVDLAYVRRSDIISWARYAGAN